MDRSASPRFTDLSSLPVAEEVAIYPLDVLAAAACSGGSAGGLQKPNDCNQDGTLDISDGVCLLGHLFLGKPSELPCGDGTVADEGNIDLLDASGDRQLDLSDAVGVFNFLFTGGKAPRTCAEPGCEGCVPVAGCGTAPAPEAAARPRRCRVGQSQKSSVNHPGWGSFVPGAPPA